jgi:pimeloyl-ACP methyl ester carboxylesterase
MELPFARRLALLVLVAGAAIHSPAALPAAEAAHDPAEDERLVLAAGRAIVREAADYSFRRWLRARVWDESDEARYGLQFEKGAEKFAPKTPDQPLVVLVHGYNSTPHRNAAVLAPIKNAGYPTASFAYPNDWEIHESATLLSRQLNDFAARHPDRRIALVTHSMGGLVARACIEDASLDPGNVDQLVMIAPPSQGTLVAHVAVATDIWEHWLGRSDGGCWTRWRDSVVDGLGEAADDLVPGSPFLTTLNGRSRNPRVDYSIFLGTGAAVSQDEMNWMRAALEKTGKCPGFATCTGKLEDLLSDMEEIVDGKGDGVVAIKRGRLEGVDDVVILPFGHLNCTGDPDCEAVRQVQQELMARLR